VEVLRSGRRRAVHGPDVAEALDLKLRRDPHAAALALRDRQGLDQRVGERRHRRHERSGRDRLPIAEHGLLAGGRGQAGVQQQLHAAFPQDPLRELAELPRNFGEDTPRPAASIAYSGQ